MQPRANTKNAEQLRRRFRLSIYPVFFILGLLPFVALAGPGDLDPTFGNGGKVISSPSGMNADIGKGMALLPDGKILLVGHVFLAGVPNTGFIVARYTANGSLDATWGTNGSVSVPFPGSQAAAASVAVQPDGKIVVVGSLSLPSAPSDFAIARLNEDGSLDTTFDTDGRVVVSFGEFITPQCAYSDFAQVVQIASDGKIVVGGSSLCFPIGGRFVITRLNTNGSLDSGFATSGRMIHPLIGLMDMLHDLTVLPDGSMVAVGRSDSSINSYRIAIKYNVNGSVGWSHVVAGGGSLNGVAVQSDGKVIATGSRAGKIAAMRFNSDGSVDDSFNTPSTTPAGHASSAAVQPDGKIVAAIAYQPSNENGEFSAIRFNPNGSLDPTFGGDGISDTTVVTTTNSFSEDFGFKLVIQPDGKILIGGSVRETEPEWRFAMVRYRGGNLVSEKARFDYDGDGKSDVSVFRPADSIWYLNRSGAGFTAVQWGNATDRIVPADYDGDGKADIAIYRNGDWWILQSSNGVVRVINFGIAEDKPQAGDFDGDGLDDAAVFRPSNGTWYVFRSTDSGYHAVPFGASADIPQRSDYDDDGKTDLAVFRPANGTWYIQKSTGGFLITQFGLNGDVPVAGDYDGDSKPDVAVWRPSSGDWYILRTSNGQIDRTNFGVVEDIPVPADYNGDGRVDIAVFRPSTGVWYQYLSPSGQWAQQVFGLSGDRPTPSAYGP